MLEGAGDIVIIFKKYLKIFNENINTEIHHKKNRDVKFNIT